MLKPFRIAYLLALAGMFVFTGIQAGELYKWQDETGIWHFSSMPPDHDEGYVTLDMPAENNPLATLRKLGTQHEPEYSAINHTWGPVELMIELQDAENVITDPPLPASFTVPGQAERRLLSIRAIDPHQGFSYRLSYKQMVGPPLEALPPEFDYYPPFPKGMQFPISQGFDNDITHNEVPNQYAVDIVMPIGTPVLAARGGTVIELEQGFRDAGESNKFLARANLIRILHDDGTMAVYAHLDTNSVRVRRGAKVKQGQWIANSGNTGYSSGPHLHFVIQLNAGMSLQSLPFRFVAADGQTLTPENRSVIDGVLPN